jgi:hypothetical protein
MIRRLSQLVALLTAIAASLNAQCAVTCSFMTGAAVSSPAVQSGHHACCPRHHEPENHPAPSGVCPQNDARLMGARIESARPSIPVPAIAILAYATVEFILPQLRTAIDLRSSSDPPESNPPTSISVLRV